MSYAGNKVISSLIVPNISAIRSVSFLGSANGILIAGENSVAGSWSYQFNLPTSITFDQYDNMYIMDSGNNRIQQWSPGFTYGVTIANAVIASPRGLAFDTAGNLIVADYLYHRVLQFTVSCRESL